MAGKDWTEHAELFENQSKLYSGWMKKAGFDRIEHYGMVSFGDPRLESFLQKINKTVHIYKLGDRLSKIAHEHYGDSRYWWVIAWFNSKPTDFHCKIGDIIEVPRPLDEVLLQIHDRVDT